MTNSNLTYLKALLDRSGSMKEIKDDVEGGYDSFIAEQRKVPGECLVSLSQFDTVYESVYRNLPIDQVPPLVIEPRNGTALLDALARTILELGADLNSMTEDARPGAVIVPILTDGKENSSVEFVGDKGLSTIKAMIEEQTNRYGWLFLYLGANQDAIQVASGIGIPAGQSLTYSGANTNEVFRSLSTNTTNYRHAAAAGASHDEALKSATFTDKQRERATSPR